MPPYPTPNAHSLRSPMQIRLRQYSFSISAPYKAGHRLTAEEAQALNGARAEQIKNNMRRHVETVCRDLPEGTLLPDSEIARLRARVELLDQGHQFRLPAESGDRLDALQVEALRVAQLQVEAEARWLAGLQSATPLSAEALELRIQRRAEMPEVIEEARQRLQQRSLQASKMLEELL